jgi:cytidine deaminase
MTSAPEIDKLHGLTVEEVQLLSQDAAAAKSRAYCKFQTKYCRGLVPLTDSMPGPYSKFQVGCSILLKEPSSSLGSTISGANVENAAYPVGTCAERVAFGTAIASGLRAGDFRAIAVATNTSEPCSPCGMCRQFIREFCDLSTPIFMFTKDGSRVVKTLGEVSALFYHLLNYLLTEYSCYQCPSVPRISSSMPTNCRNMHRVQSTVFQLVSLDTR